MAQVVEFIKKEFLGWGKFERIIFPLEILFIVSISIYMQDDIVALISAICGICATILAGKGKISCYVFGMIANLCYSYISFKNGFWGNLSLNMLYYFPMQFVGIAHWRNHLKEDVQVIYKTQLNNKAKVIYSLLTVVATIATYFILLKFNGKNPVMDSITTVFSIVALVLAIKRCADQWYLWFVVNFLSVIMWIGAYINGSNCFATILMWSTYLILGIYFMYQWQKELDSH